MKKAKGIDGKLDDAWSELIKLIAGYKCEYTDCNKREYLNSHHIFSRSNKSVRWSVENGICLCSGHHVLNNNSAHKAPLDFTDWITEYKGKDFIDELRLKAHSTKKWSKYEKEIELVSLNELIQKYKDYA